MRVRLSLVWRADILDLATPSSRRAKRLINDFRNSVEVEAFVLS